MFIHPFTTLNRAQEGKTMPKGIFKRKKSFRENARQGALNSWQSFERRKRMSQLIKRKWKDPEYRKTILAVITNIKHSEETKRKLSRLRKGTHASLEARLHMSEAQKGRKHSEKTKRKIGTANSGRNCHLWRGGVSCNPYPKNWTRTLKRSIRERDSYTCGICEKEPAIHVHHIDYDKNNCNPSNLVTLCTSCHSKTCCNRNQWKQYFKQKGALNGRY